jgi:hypothetical protein
MFNLSEGDIMQAGAHGDLDMGIYWPGILFVKARAYNRVTGWGAEQTAPAVTGFVPISPGTVGTIWIFGEAILGDLCEGSLRDEDGTLHEGLHFSASSGDLPHHPDRFTEDVDKAFIIRTDRLLVSAGAIDKWRAANQTEAPKTYAEIPVIIPESAADDDSDLAALFDPVKRAQLETMFPAGGKWVSYADHAGRNGLIEAKAGRGLFNPYKAARWWLTTGPDGWSWERCIRRLANNLPDRSLDLKHLLTGNND